jgi:hypothetical protein
MSNYQVVSRHTLRPLNEVKESTDTSPLKDKEVLLDKLPEDPAIITITNVAVDGKNVNDDSGNTGEKQNQSTTGKESVSLEGVNARREGGCGECLLM